MRVFGGGGLPCSPVEDAGPSNPSGMAGRLLRGAWRVVAKRGLCPPRKPAHMGVAFRSRPPPTPRPPHGMHAGAGAARVLAWSMTAVGSKGMRTCQGNGSSNQPCSTERTPALAEGRVRQTVAGSGTAVTRVQDRGGGSEACVSRGSWVQHGVCGSGSRPARPARPGDASQHSSSGSGSGDDWWSSPARLCRGSLSHYAGDCSALGCSSSSCQLRTDPAAARLSRSCCTKQATQCAYIHDMMHPVSVYS